MYLGISFPEFWAFLPTRQGERKALGVVSRKTCLAHVIRISASLVQVISILVQDGTDQVLILFLLCLYVFLEDQLVS